MPVFLKTQFHELGTPLVMDGGVSGNVFAYNNILAYHIVSSDRYLQHGALSFHGAHPTMNLFEGNVIRGRVFADFYHGNSAYNTFFRNKIYLDTEGQINNWLMNIFKKAWYYNLVGNVMGSPGFEITYEATGVNVNYDSSKIIYRLGYQDNSGSWQTTATPVPYGPADTQVKPTLLRHANWDSVTNSQKWCADSGEPGCQGGDGSAALPSSLYLASKPAWYGNCTWPPVDPNGPTVNDIPAKLRYEGKSCNGTPPTCATADANSDGSINISDVQTCINVILGTDINASHKTCSDMNSNSTVEISDCQAIINKILNP